MPLYEYYCGECDAVFEALRPVRDSERPAGCPRCGREAERIMPTSFASRSLKQGYFQRVPYHHRPVRSIGHEQRTIARVKPKPAQERGGKRGKPKGRKEG